ncbi:Uncharacterised protein [Mycobacteroides abscessus subsp. abscessus]|nr:Uncharacterised protein [Mycobacteroides abscessus subsp. abscessus]
MAVFMHTGAAMPEFLSGYSVAVHSDGRQVRVDLRDVYERAAAEFGIRIGQIPVVGYLGAIVR